MPVFGPHRDGSASQAGRNPSETARDERRAAVVGKPRTANLPATRRVIAPAAAAETARLVQTEDVVYQGAFRVPQGTIAGSSFDFGGTALTFNSARGSLFLV